MRVQYLKNSEPYTKGDVVEVDSEVGKGLVENETAEEVSADTDLKVQAVDAELTVAPGAQGKNANDLRKRKVEAQEAMAQAVEDSESDTDYSKQSAKELTALAESRGLAIPDGAKKADLVELLESNDRS